MLVEIMVLVLGSAMAGLLIAAVAIAVNNQGNMIADRVSQADAYLATAYNRSKGSSEPPALVLTAGSKSVIRPAVQP